VALGAVDINHYVGSFIPSAQFAGKRRLVAEAEVQGSLLTAFSEFDMCPIQEGTSGTIPLDNGNLLLSYDSSSVFKTLFMDIQKDHGGGSLTYHLGPEDMVLNQGFTIAMKLNEHKTHFGLFLRSRRGWELLASGNNVVNGMLSGRVTQTLGEVGVFADNLPPSISGVNIQHPRPGQVSISFRFSNDFAGVEYDSLKMYLDGEVVIPEIDGEHRRALYRSTESLEHGSHLLSIRIMDMLGNATEVERRFNIQ